MFCSTCGNQLTTGLSFCNRCGTNLKDRNNSAQSGTMAAFLTAITLIGLGGLGIMLGGTMALRLEAQASSGVIGAFMFMTFVLVLVVEVFLCRQLSRLSATSQKSLPAQPNKPAEMHPAQQQMLPEPLPSVTENTTRTLEYSRSEARR